MSIMAASRYLYRLYIPLFLWGTVEACIGILQVLGWLPSNNMAFMMTGSFENPGPFGGFLAIMMSMSGAYLIMHRHDFGKTLGRVTLTTSMACFCSCMLVLPASMSRAAWAAFLISFMVVLLSDSAVCNWTYSHKTVCALATALALSLFAAAFFLKEDSAIGRLHIWHMESVAIMEHPLGTGPGSALATYGEVQEEYFRANLGRAPKSVIRAAGCPEYPFNEYLHIGMEYGIPGLLIFVAVLVLAIRSLAKRGNACCYGLVAWSVFAFASYPLSVPKLNLLFGTLLLVAAFNTELPVAWRYAFSVIAILLTACLYVSSSKKAEFRNLYEIGYSQFMAGDYKNSLGTLKEGSEMSCDPMFHIIMGRCHEAMGDIDAAEQEYWTARYMVPCRIYPLVRLTRLYVKAGDNESAIRCAREAAGMPVNERHLTMINLQEEISITLDSLLLCK